MTINITLLTLLLFAGVYIVWLLWVTIGDVKELIHISNEREEKFLAAVNEYENANEATTKFGRAAALASARILADKAKEVR